MKDLKDELIEKLGELVLILLPHYDEDTNGDRTTHNIKRLHFEITELKSQIKEKPKRTAEEIDPTKDTTEILNEREALFQAFDKIRASFKGRHWLMEGRGCYPYDDERYKEEVRYIMDEFEEINTNLWKQIKSKSFEYRKSIEEPLQKRIAELEGTFAVTDEASEEMPNNSQSESALNIYAKKCNLVFTKPTGIAQGWRACYEWISQFKQVETKEEPKELTLYSFLYNPMIEESSTQTVSIHRTRKGAEMAMEFYKAEQLKEWEELYKDDKGMREFCPFGHFQWWGIGEITVND